MWKRTFKFLVKEFPCMALLDEKNIHFGSSLAITNGPLFCRLETLDIQSRISLEFCGFGVEDFKVGSYVFGIHLPMIGLWTTLSEVDGNILKGMIERRVGLPGTDEALYKFIILHELGHYLDYLENGFTEETALLEEKSMNEIRMTTYEEGEEAASLRYREIPGEAYADNFAISMLRRIPKRGTQREATAAFGYTPHPATLEHSAFGASKPVSSEHIRDLCSGRGFFSSACKVRDKVGDVWYMSCTYFKGECIVIHDRYLLDLLGVSEGDLVYASDAFESFRVEYGLDTVKFIVMSGFTSPGHMTLEWEDGVWTITGCSCIMHTEEFFRTWFAALALRIQEFERNGLEASARGVTFNEFFHKAYVLNYLPEMKLSDWRKLL